MYRWIEKEDELFVYGLVTRYGPQSVATHVENIWPKIAIFAQF